MPCRNPMHFPTSISRNEYLELFFRAYSLISSRAFHIDEYYDDALVPLADLFNHNSFEDIFLDNNKDVCYNCGELHCFCETNQVQTKKTILSEKEKLQNLSARYLEVVTVQSIKPNSEIFNSFGKLPNSVLLTRYGFVEENNPFDVVHFSEKEFINFAKREKILGRFNENLLESRINLWKSCRSRIDLIEEGIDIQIENMASEILQTSMGEDFQMDIEDCEDTENPDLLDDPVSYNITNDEDAFEVVKSTDLTVDSEGVPDVGLLTLAVLLQKNVTSISLPGSYASVLKVPLHSKYSSIIPRVITAINPPHLSNYTNSASLHLHSSLNLNKKSSLLADLETEFNLEFNESSFFKQVKTVKDVCDFVINAEVKNSLGIM
ncbi:hypothetical protein HK099_003962 [Clydaea vesicula]|uniref:SET domain-containing protein n=1 Tax=Clydaea vesicula TaxID=447962 RepID=A0AAD5XYN8_9FUNG|nr:hypothetical protein HK099_003962 [Clydaea vesicula]